MNTNNILNEMHNAELKINDTIDSCVSIEQLESACQMANNFVLNIENGFIRKPFKFIGYNPFKWASNYNRYKYIQNSYLDLKTRIQERLDSQTEIIQPAIQSPEKVIVRGFC